MMSAAVPVRLRVASVALEPVWQHAPVVTVLANIRGKSAVSARARASLYVQPVKERDLFHDEFKTFF